MIRALNRARSGQPQHHTLAGSTARVEKSTYSFPHTHRSHDQGGSEGRVVEKAKSLLVAHWQQLVLS